MTNTTTPDMKHTEKAPRMDNELDAKAGDTLLTALLLRDSHADAAELVEAMKEETLPRIRALRAASTATLAVLKSTFAGVPEAMPAVEGLLDSLRDTARSLAALDQRRGRLIRLGALVETQRDVPDGIRTATRWNPLALGCMACGQRPGWLFDRTHPDKDNPANWATLCFDHWTHYHQRTEEAEQAGYMIPVDLHEEDGPEEHPIGFRGERAGITAKGEIVI